MSAGGRNRRPPRQRQGKKPASKRQYRIAAALAVALVVLLAVLLHGNTESQRYERYRRQAAESYQNGDYDQALSDLRKAEAIRPDNEVLMLMADCYEAQGNWDMALETLRRMDLEDKAVRDRIAALEQRRLQQQGDGQIVIAGENYDAGVTALNLNGRGMGDGVMQQVVQLHALTELSLAENALSDVTALASLGGLRTLDLSGNAIRDVTALGGLSNLHSLILDRNPLEDLRPLYGLEDLSLLSLRGVPLEEGELEALSAALPRCAILTDSGREGILSICLGGVCFDSDVTELDLSGLQLREVECLSLCPGLKSLNLSDNTISDLSPLMNLQNLEQLTITANQVSDLRPLMGLTALRRLDAAGNNIGDTSAIGNMPGLKSLDLSDNPIRDFSGLKKATGLETLRLENTGADDDVLPYLYGLNRLTRLALDRNEGITDDAMSALKKELPNCSISHGELVYVVQLGGEEFRTDAESLTLEGSELADLYGLEKMDRLVTVKLGRNRIEKLSVFQDSRSRDRIVYLDLSYNRIQDVSPLSALTAVETLDLRGNSISSVRPLMHLTSLRRLVLTGNPLTDEQIEELRQALPGCEIEF